MLDILQIFRKYNVNISYIDSRPSRIEHNEYLYFVDFEGNINEENIKNLVNELKENVPYYRFVGSYERF